MARTIVRLPFLILQDEGGEKLRRNTHGAKLGADERYEAGHPE